MTPKEFLQKAMRDRTEFTCAIFNHIYCFVFYCEEEGDRLEVYANEDRYFKASFTDYDVLIKTLISEAKYNDLAIDILEMIY